MSNEDMVWNSNTHHSQEGIFFIRVFNSHVETEILVETADISNSTKPDVARLLR